MPRRNGANEVEEGAEEGEEPELYQGQPLARLQYRSDDDDSSEDDDSRRAQPQSESESESESGTTTKTKDGYFQARQEGGPLGVPEPRPVHAGAAAELAGHRVQLPDGKIGEVVDAGNGFFTVQLAHDVVKMRRHQLTKLDGDDEQPAAAESTRSEEVQREKPPPRHRGQPPSSPPPARLPPLVPQPKDLIGKVVRLSGGRLGTVNECGHGFYQIDIDEQDGGGFVKLRGNQLNLLGPQQVRASRQQQAVRLAKRREGRDARARARNDEALLQAPREQTAAEASSLLKRSRRGPPSAQTCPRRRGGARPRSPASPEPTPQRRDAGGARPFARFCMIALRIALRALWSSYPRTRSILHAR